jgi:hypothetical protein
MTNRSNDNVASRLLGAISFWLGVTVVGIGFGAFIGFVSPTGDGYERGISALVLVAGFISVYGGGLGAVGFLIAEIILPRISAVHAGRLYLFSGLVGVIITTIGGFISGWVLSCTGRGPLSTVVYSVVFFAFSIIGSLLFLAIAQRSGILRTEPPAGTKDT